MGWRDEKQPGEDQEGVNDWIVKKDLKQTNKQTNGPLKPKAYLQLQDSSNKTTSPNPTPKSTTN